VVTVGVGVLLVVTLGVGVGVFVASIGGNGPSSIKDIDDLNDEATV
jgi:hypothetical protein